MKAIKEKITQPQPIEADAKVAVTEREDINAVNDRILRLQVHELHRGHTLAAPAIARILHVDKGWVSGVLRELRKTGK